ncbi:hypothetical protein ACJRO7_027444 [Eucalyptus globulus]|uniref:Sialate O-acetylesterase domain-containing protein n=1 Tax=Eucalyptus globulus TaxID=34317 RepID=A0ABD3JR74_EUCGL
MAGRGGVTRPRGWDGVVPPDPAVLRLGAALQWEEAQEPLHLDIDTRKAGGGEIKALLWYQGESDASTHHDAEAYGEKMEALIKNVRNDLGLPSLPVIPSTELFLCPLLNRA